MNETSPPSPTSPPTTLAIVHTLRDDVLAPAVRGQEALEDGDALYAAEIFAAIEENALRLVTQLEAGHAHKADRFICPCGTSFRWPGELADHRRVSHFEEDRCAA